MTTSIRTDENNQAGAVVFAGIDNITLKSTGPELQGTPRAPTATVGANSTQVANTAFVTAALAAVSNVLPSDTTPAVNSGTGSAGTTAKYSRGDHVHPATAATVLPSDTTPNSVSSAGLAGTSSKYSRSDHVHANNISPSDTTPLAVSTAGNAGALSLYSRSDHVHANNVLPSDIAPPTISSTSSAGSAALYARGDHTHANNVLPSAVTPALPTVAGAVGAGTAYARSDHSHPAGAQSLTSSGYATLPGGLILQWGFGTFGSGGSAILFPITFPNAVFSITATCATATTPEAVGISAQTTGGFTGKTATSLGCFWLAVGR